MNLRDHFDILIFGLTKQIFFVGLRRKGKNLPDDVIGVKLFPVFAFDHDVRVRSEMPWGVTYG